MGMNSKVIPGRDAAPVISLFHYQCDGKAVVTFAADGLDDLRPHPPPSAVLLRRTGGPVPQERKNRSPFLGKCIRLDRLDAHPQNQTQSKAISSPVRLRLWFRRDRVEAQRRRRGEDKR